MKRYVLHILGGLVLLGTLAFVFGCYWVMATAGGSAWLIRTVASRMPETVAVQTVEGRLTDELRLSGLEVRWTGGTATIGRLTWRWRAAGLLHRNVRIRSLNLEDVTLVTIPEKDQPREPLDLAWPELPGWMQKIHVALDDVQIKRLRWQQPDGPSFYLQGLAAKARWTGRRLRIPIVTALSDAGAWTARAAIDWHQPGLRLKGAALTKPDTQTAVPLILALTLQPGEQPGSLTGTLHAGAQAPAAGILQLATPFVVTPTDLRLDNFDLRSLSSTGSLHGKVRLDWAEPKPRLELSADLKNLDLATLAGQTTHLDGHLTLKADPDAYAGTLALNNRATQWRDLRLETSFSGNRQNLDLTDLNIHGLDGTIDGDANVRWTPQLSIRGKLSGHDLNPQRAGLAWPGNINLQAEGVWSRLDQGGMSARIDARLLPSTLRDAPLQGQIRARLQNEDVQIDTLQLQSRGLDLTARGRLQQRIDFAARVDDLASLVPELTGAMQGRGWIRWRNQQVAGELNGSGRALQHGQLGVRNLRFSAALAANRSGSLEADLTGLQYNDVQISALSIRGNGRPEQHSLSARITLPRQTQLKLTAAGGYEKSAWQGSVTELTLRDAIDTLNLADPAALSVSQKGLKLAALRLTGTSGEALSAAAQIQYAPLIGRGQLAWEQLRLAHAQAWLDGTKITGNSSGNASWEQTADGAFALLADLKTAGSLEREGRQLHLAGAEASLSWTPARLQAELHADLKQGGRLQGRIQGGRSTSMTLPEQADWQWLCRDLDLQLLAPWLPSGIAIQGILSGQSTGKLLPGRQLIADGRITVTGGQIATDKEQGQITVPVQNAELNWNWRGEELSGQTEVQLGDYGHLNGSFRLPIPARMPVKPAQQGALDIIIDGRSTELGLFAALMPGAVQESRGRVEIKLRGDGTWQQPQLNGQVQLLEAGAYLPIAGLELQKVNILARLDGDRILLDNLSLQSGKGTLRGKGSLQLHDWKPGNYNVTLKGQGVQLVNLPEIQIQADPDLLITGSTSELKVTGTVKLSEVMIRDNKKPSLITPSDDVVMVGEQSPEKPSAEFPIQADIRLLLGDHVLVKASGLDARLTGELHLSSIDSNALTANGRIAVAEGMYAAYGTRLDITRGNLLFNGPLAQPTLDIVALRTVGKIKAGVQVSGTPRLPVVKLTSEPAMSDSDRLAYIVLGRASARNAGEADLLMTAGGLLLSQGESVVMRDRLKRQLGVDVLGFETGSATGQDDVSSSMLTIGKYLSPSLYVSIGQSLFANTQEFRLRYSLGKHWQLESTTGEESGVDLYYKIEFR
ncbi:protein of unknown function, DUF490-containing [Syntrophotalea carbinolica DSM 2380]|uniref:Translocation and assembly module TamB C-terminal domain-containing protein n=1 Tax=Syntrophotalea carbinolica (strain DSM 2380 / NBRC 103641 / GraBd1) TaxID=338963 RepID=Q3A844_SYNC1|nr:translocation/assembly module TamB domain-containing protein [Syntrophotalea carbinolica]ABA87448.1 protein of unknown function, DUF490-containing [Syntrophotalea carbinolica DSM 2380]